VELGRGGLRGWERSETCISRVIAKMLQRELELGEN
jgi:hypothetical protein